MAYDVNATTGISFKEGSSLMIFVALMKMPHNGGATFDQLKEINAEVKIIIVSGYTEDQRIREMLVQGCNGFLQKPFSINVLSQEIMNALNY